MKKLYTLAAVLFSAFFCANAQTGDDKVLNDEGSPLIKEWSYPGNSTTVYGGYVYMGEELGDYKYLVMTYKGNLIEARFEFTDGTNKSSPVWFAKWQEKKFTFSGDIMEIDAETPQDQEFTIIIDLAASGIDLSKYNAFYVHNGGGTEISPAVSFNVSNAYLTKTLPEIGDNNDNEQNPGDNDNESTGVADVVADEAGAEVVGIYSILGSELKAEPESGAFIVKFSNGTAKKFVK